MSKSLAKMVETEPNRLMLVDSLNMSFSFRGKTSYHDKYINMVESLKRSYSCSKVIICCDDGASSYRKNLYPAYKANRAEKYKNQTEHEQQEFQLFLEEFGKVISTYQEMEKYPVLKFKGVEADDILAYITRVVGHKYPDIHTTLISTDKDIDLLVSDNVSRFSYVTRKETRLDNWNEHYEYDPCDHISIKCITGDSGDNIPGVPGIGPKKAHALVREYGSCYDIIASLPITSRYKHIANLNDFGANALILNYKLMDLVSHCEEALGETNCRTIDTVLEKYL